MKGALDATIESCRPQVNCTEAIEAIIRILEKLFIFVDLLCVFGRVWFSSHVSLDADGVFSSISDTLTYYPHNMKSSIKMDVNMLKDYFSQYDSIQKEILYYLPYNVETWTGSIVQVGAVETRFNKNGTIEKERMIDKFFIGKDGLVHTMRQWNADW